MKVREFTTIDLAQWRNVSDVLLKHEPVVAGGELLSIRLDNGEMMAKDGYGRLVVLSEPPRPRWFHFVLPLTSAAAMWLFSVWAWSIGYVELNWYALVVGQNWLGLTLLSAPFVFGVPLLVLKAAFRRAPSARSMIFLSCVLSFSFLLVVVHDVSVVLGAL